MLRAYYPVIYMTTFEYDRAKQKISGVAKSLNKGYGIYEWFGSEYARRNEANRGL